MPSITFDRIQIGDKGVFAKTVTQSDINHFAEASGDKQGLHLCEEFAKATQFGGIIAHGMLTASFISTALGTVYPGEGSIFLGLNEVKFLKPVRPGDTITTTVTVTEKHPKKPVVTFECECVNQRGEKVVTAKAVVLAPTQSVSLQPQP